MAQLDEEEDTYSVKQFESFTDHDGQPQGIPGFRGLHAILEEISNKKTKELLSLNHATPGAIWNMGISLLLAETMQTSPVPVRLERDITRRVFDTAARYMKDQNEQLWKSETSMESAKAGRSDDDDDDWNPFRVKTFTLGSVVNHSISHKIILSDTEAQVFFADWEQFWSQWVFGDFHPNGNICDGIIKKNGAVFMQLEAFTDESGNPKRLVGFHGLHAILDEVLNKDRMAQLSFTGYPDTIEKTRVSLWLAELMQTSPLPTDRQTIAKVKRALLLLRGTEDDWEKHIWSDFIHDQMVLKVLGREHNLPKDVLVSIANFILPERLKRAIANRIFQVAVEFQEMKLENGFYDDYSDDQMDSDVGSDHSDDSDSMEEDT